MKLRPSSRRATNCSPKIAAILDAKKRSRILVGRGEVMDDFDRRPLVAIDRPDDDRAAGRARRIALRAPTPASPA